MNRETAANWDRFAEHRARVTSLALEASNGGSLVILGAGNCNDVDLAALTGSYQTVHLVDLDREALERAQRRQVPEVAARLQLHWSLDVGAALHRLEWLRRNTISPTNLGRLPREAAAEALSALPMRADVVISSCVLSQIVHTCHRELGSEHPHLAAIACALVVAHVRVLSTLVRSGGVGILVTDAVSSDTCALEELWPGRSPMALLEEMEAAGNHLSGTGPAFLRRLMRTDEVTSSVVLATRLAEPWLWHLDDRLTLLAYALIFRRR